MDGLDANFDALDQCRIEVTGQVGPMAAAADGLPADVGADAFGGLDGAGALANAVNSLTQSFGGEIDQASKKLEQVGVALQAVIDNVRATEQQTAETLTPAG
jgi:hypothetical protein